MQKQKDKDLICIPVFKCNFLWPSPKNQIDMETIWHAVQNDMAPVASCPETKTLFVWCEANYKNKITIVCSGSLWQVDNCRLLASEKQTDWMLNKMNERHDILSYRKVLFIVERSLSFIISGIERIQSVKVLSYSQSRTYATCCLFALALCYGSFCKSSSDFLERDAPIIQKQ